MAEQDNSLPKAPKEQTNFPEELDPAKKGRDYCLQMCRATYWYNWNIASGLNAFGNPQRNDYVENRTWADGNPNMQKFIPRVSGLKDEAGNAATYLNLDLKPVTYIPKFRDIVLNYIEKLEYEIQATAINPEAVNLKEEEKWKIYTAQIMQAWAQEMEAQAGTELFPKKEFEFDFNTKQELDILYGLTQKMREEIEIELGNELVLYESDWRMIKRMLLEDLFDNGCCSTEVFYDPITERLRTRYVDVVNMILPPFRGHDLSTPERIGYVNTMTIAQLKCEAGDEFTEQQYMQIAAQYSNKFGNGTFQFPNSFNYQYINTDSTYNYWLNFNIPVVTLYWEEIDRYKYKREIGANGEEYTKPIDYGKNKTMTADFLNSEEGKAYAEKNPVAKQNVGKKLYVEEPLGKNSYHVYKDGVKVKREKFVYAQDVHCYYQARWVPNTDYIYNYGKVEFLGRDPRDPKKALCPIKYVRITNRSLNERLQPFEEANILGWLKMQNAIAKAVPSGYSLNIATLKNASIDGKDFPVKHQVELYEQQGKLIWSSENPFDETGKVYPHPIMALPSMLVNDIQAWILLMDTNIDKMRGVTGINELMDASTPNSELAATNAKLAVTGATNSISPLSFAITYIQEKMAVDIAEKLRLITQYGPYRGYMPDLGTHLIRSMSMSDPGDVYEVGGNVRPFSYGIKILARPSEEMRMDLKETAKAAVVNVADPVKGGLYYHDYLRLCRLIDGGTNLKAVEAIMAYTIQKNLNQMQQMAAQNSKVAAEESIKAQQAADASKLEMMQKEAQVEVQAYWEKKKADAWFEQQRSAAHTENQVVVKSVASGLKKDEETHKATVGNK